jgi:hypothetical protein
VRVSPLGMRRILFRLECSTVRYRS